MDAQDFLYVSYNNIVIRDKKRSDPVPNIKSGCMLKFSNSNHLSTGLMVNDMMSLFCNDTEILSAIALKEYGG